MRVPQSNLNALAVFWTLLIAAEAGLLNDPSHRLFRRTKTAVVTVTIPAGAGPQIDGPGNMAQATSGRPNAIEYNPKESAFPGGNKASPTSRVASFPESPGMPPDPFRADSDKGCNIQPMSPQVWNQERQATLEWMRTELQRYRQNPGKSKSFFNHVLEKYFPDVAPSHTDCNMVNGCSVGLCR